MDYPNQKKGSSKNFPDPLKVMIQHPAYLVYPILSITFYIILRKTFEGIGEAILLRLFQITRRLVRLFCPCSGNNHVNFIEAHRITFLNLLDNFRLA